MDKGKELPKGWALTKLGEICYSPQYGYTTKAVSTGNIKLLRTTDITSGKINWDTVPYCLNNPEEPEKYILKNEDIVISRAGSVGVSYLIKNPEYSVFASYLIRFNPLINKKFFKFFLDSPFYWNNISEKKLGIAIPNVNANKLKDIDFPIAPLLEQHRIVAKIEELFSDLDKGIEQLKTAQQQLKVYRQAVLKWAFEGKLTEKWRETHHVEPAEKLLEHIKEEREKHYQEQLEEWQKAIKEWEVNGKEGKKPSKPKKLVDLSPFTEDELLNLSQLPEKWCWVKLGTICEKIQIGPFGSLLHKSDYIEDGIPLVNPSQIKELRICSDSNLTVSERKYLELSNYVMKDKDIVMGRRGEMGRCAVVSERENDWLCGTGSLYIRLILNVSYSYFYCLVLSSNRIKNFLEKKSIGTTMKNLNQNILYNIPIPICSYQEQHQIVQEIETRLSVCDNIEANIEESLQKAEALRQSILKKAFEGKLVPQDPNDEPAHVLLERIKAEKANQDTEKKKSNNRKKRKTYE